MKILARADAIGIDGTFKISPKLWKQLLIVTIEVIPGEWVPVAYALLPDKQLDSYVTALNLMIQRKFTLCLLYICAF